MRTTGVTGPPDGPSWRAWQPSLTPSGASSSPSGAPSTPSRTSSTPSRAKLTTPAKPSRTNRQTKTASRARSTRALASRVRLGSPARAPLARSSGSTSASEERPPGRMGHGGKRDHLEIFDSRADLRAASSTVTAKGNRFSPNFGARREGACPRARPRWSSEGGYFTPLASLLAASAVF